MLARRVFLLGRSPSARTRTAAAHRAWIHSTPSCCGKTTVHKFKLADIGEGITECEVIKWNVGPKSAVQTFDPLCEVQSDKASVEITSPFDGTVKELLVAEGQIAKVGEGLCLIEVEGDSAGTAGAAEEDSASSTSAGGTPIPQTQDVVQKGEGEAPRPSQPRRTHPLDPRFVDAPSSQTQPPPSPPPSPRSLGVDDVDILAAPSVRHFARKNGVDLVLVAPGSGKDGRVEKGDVEAYLDRLSSSSSSSSSSPSANPQVKVGEAKGQTEDVVVELGRTRYGMWKAMTKSLEIPTFGYTTSLDLTPLHNLLPTLNASIPSHFLPPPSWPLTTPSKAPLVDPSGFYPAPSPPNIPESGRYSKLTYLPILLKTLSKAMIEWPIFRSSITPSSTTTASLSSPPPLPPPPDQQKPTLTLRPHADIALALSAPTGLYTPTLTSVDQSSIYALASRVGHLAYLGRQVPCGLTTKEMPKRGGTISVSNVGAIGRGESAVPVLVGGGGVAIVALGRARWVWDVEEVRDYYVGGGSGGGNVNGRQWGEKRGGGEERLKMSVSWSADHRVVEGAELAAFVESWRGWVEVPERLIGEGI